MTLARQAKDGGLGATCEVGFAEDVANVSFYGISEEWACIVEIAFADQGYTGEQPATDAAMHDR